jgi:hypothetical protein
MKCDASRDEEPRRALAGAWRLYATTVAVVPELTVRHSGALGMTAVTIRKTKEARLREPLASTKALALSRDGGGGGAARTLYLKLPQKRWMRLQASSRSEVLVA